MKIKLDVILFEKQLVLQGHSFTLSQFWDFILGRSKTEGSCFSQQRGLVKFASAPLPGREIYSFFQQKNQIDAEKMTSHINWSKS